MRRLEVATAAEVAAPEVAASEPSAPVAPATPIAAVIPAPVVVAATIVSADASLHTPEGDFVGYEGAGQFAASLRNSFSEVRFVTQEPSLTGDLATVQWTMTGFHTSDYQGLAGGGAPISLHGLAVLRFDDRVIVEQWIEYDRLALVDQIEMFALIDSCDAECLKPNENR